MSLVCKTQNRALTVISSTILPTPCPWPLSLCARASWTEPTIMWRYKRWLVVAKLPDFVINLLQQRFFVTYKLRDFKIRLQRHMETIFVVYSRFEFHNIWVLLWCKSTFFLRNCFGLCSAAFVLWCCCIWCVNLSEMDFHSILRRFLYRNPNQMG